MNASVAAARQINLYNPALVPRREQFSARQLVAWVVIAASAMAIIAWWAASQTRSLRHEMAAQTVRSPAGPGGDAAATPQQVDALEKALRDRKSALEARKAARDALARGMAGPDRGPSAVMRRIADSIPATAWLTELRAAGGRIDVRGRALDPAAIDGWLDRLRTSGLVAPSPVPAVKLERIDAPPGPAAGLPPAYAFHISAALSSPFADEGIRP